MNSTVSKRLLLAIAGISAIALMGCAGSEGGGAFAVLSSGSYVPEWGMQPDASAAVQGDGVVAYVPNGSASNVEIVPVMGTIVNPAVVNTPNPVSSCAVDQSLELVVCTSTGTDVYVFNADGSGLQTLSSSGSNVVGFTAGTCTTCGVTIDSIHHMAAIGVALGGGASSGYQLLDLTQSPPAWSAPIPAISPQAIAENWAIDSARSFILSPTQTQSSGAPSADYQIFDFRNPNAPIAYSFAESSAVFSGTVDLGAAAEDSTGIVLASDEGTGNVFLADLKQASYDWMTLTWDAPNQLQLLPEFSSGFLAGTSAIAVAYGAHQALLEDAAGTTAFGALQLPSTSGSGTPAVQDWVIAQMPDTPDGADWQNALGTKGLAAGAFHTSTDQGFGILMNNQRTFLAEINLTDLLQATRTMSAPSHTIDPGVDLVGSGIVTFVPIPGN